ncbi:MAG TPA: flavin reductase family protein [Phycisphaerales bacterium]|nr:flavin reductase family protein [Phycisphaerales bacterium]
MSDTRIDDPKAAIERVPGGTFVMTAAFEGKRAGVVVRSVQPCAEEPLLICVAAKKGHWIEPLIRDSHAFAICRVSPDNRLIQRKFSTELADHDETRGDPFDAFPTETLVTGSPVLLRSIVAFDCEVVRHFDLEADHELFVGLVLASRMYGRQ